jgi:hypothetical protein
MEVYIPAWINSEKKKETTERPGLYLPLPEMEHLPEKEEKPESTGGTVVIIQL